MKKIAFCITCMNRLFHIQKTLLNNIEDNFLPEDVEFILLDYNSTDGLEDWVKTLREYIDKNILTYYKATTPQYYNRSHSRNMVFRLANSEIVCNLDADNYLGKGFADYIIKEFKNSKERIFITPILKNRDVFGRFCAYRDDFMHIKGYNESLSGYGMEDIDLFDRLFKSGLQRRTFINPNYYKVIQHSDKERVSQEYCYKNFTSAYLAYLTPYSVKFLVLYRDFSCEFGYLTNNFLCNYNNTKKHSNHIDFFFDPVNRIILESQLNTGKWFIVDDKIKIVLNDEGIEFHKDALAIEYRGLRFHKVTDKEVSAQFVRDLTDAKNFEIVTNARRNNPSINSEGFGKGIVYQNFDYRGKIILD
ncbi:glycosyltransferase family 2 protein [Parabacteroides sp. OttesenSCG-928-G21]|nr:glycosyltransferase family 2 protein [Parabacteroides sp. OttesenSCG-928-G21]